MRVFKKIRYWVLKPSIVTCMYYYFINRAMLLDFVKQNINRLDRLKMGVYVLRQNNCHGKKPICCPILLNILWIGLQLKQRMTNGEELLSSY